MRDENLLRELTQLRGGGGADPSGYRRGGGYFPGP